MSPTKRLYYEDAHLFSFSARVVGRGEWEGRPAVVLDKTAFYPESGGQSGDRGSIGPVAVLDTQIDTNGTIQHIVAPAAADALEIDSEVCAEIDVRRRRDHMAQHTGQHMLSSAAWRVLQAKTVSSRLGRSHNTIDIDIRSISPEQIGEIESLVNEKIDEDLAVETFFPSSQELERLPLRRSAKVGENVRVVAVGDFDLVPCGGTHTARTGQVGLLKILSAESYKKKVRITFVCGQKARRLLGEHFEVLGELGRQFTCHPQDVPAAIARLRRDFETERAAHRESKSRLAGMHAKSLLQNARGDSVIALFEGLDVETLKEIAKEVIRRPNAVALLASQNPGGCDVFVTRHPDSHFDCGELVKSVANAARGRGGGRPEHAAGRLPHGADWKQLLREQGLV